MNFVTGATGIVGSHIIAELLKKNQSVRVLLRPGSDRSALDTILQYHGCDPDLLEVKEGSLNDVAILQEGIVGCERVYHCAAMVSFRPEEQARMYDVNIVGTRHIVNICNALDVPLTYISSTAAIGDQKEGDCFTEHSTWTTDRGRSAYSLSKRYAELEVFRGVEEGLDATILNPGVIIGPGKWGESSTTIFLSGQKGMRFYPSGGNGFVDARDVAEVAVDLPSKHSNGRHLLVGENLSFQKVFTLAAYAFDKKGPSILMPRTPVRVVWALLRALEGMRLNFFSVSSENLKSAYRKVCYENDKASTLGYKFRSMDEAFTYTKKVFNLSRGA